jgi:hypothetical protein
MSQIDENLQENKELEVITLCKFCKQDCCDASHSLNCNEVVDVKFVSKITLPELASISPNITSKNLDDYLNLDNPEVRLRKLVSTSKLRFNLNKVTYRDGGVFATSNIAMGEIITIHPVHFAIFFFEGRSNDPLSKCIKMLISSNEYNYSEDINCRHRFDMNKYYTIIGHPSSVADPVYLGHMISEGGTSFDSEESYEFSVQERVNSRFLCIDTLVIVCTATRDIKADDEILISYGYDYHKLVGIK